MDLGRPQPGQLGDIVLSQLNPEWSARTEARLRATYSNFDTLPQELRSKLFIQHFLTTDALICFKGTLPDLVNESELQGTYLVQIEDAIDVSKTIKNRCDTAFHSSRLLKLQLTDGKRSYIAIEHRPLPQINPPDLLRGSKAILIGPIPYKRCALLLQPHNFCILGGSVEELEEQRRALIDHLMQQPVGQRGPTPTLEQYMASTARAVIERCPPANTSRNAAQNGGHNGPIPGPQQPPSPEQFPTLSAPTAIRVDSPRQLQPQPPAQRPIYQPQAPQRHTGPQGGAISGAVGPSQGIPSAQIGPGSISFGSGRVPPTQAAPYEHQQGQHHYHHQQQVAPNGSFNFHPVPLSAPRPSSANSNGMHMGHRTSNNTAMPIGAHVHNSSNISNGYVNPINRPGSGTGNATGSGTGVGTGTGLNNQAPPLAAAHQQHQQQQHHHHHHHRTATAPTQAAQPIVGAIQDGSGSDEGWSSESEDEFNGGAGGAAAAIGGGAVHGDGGGGNLTNNNTNTNMNINNITITSGEVGDGTVRSGERGGLAPTARLDALQSSGPGPPAAVHGSGGGLFSAPTRAPPPVGDTQPPQQDVIDLVSDDDVDDGGDEFKEEEEEEVYEGTEVMEEETSLANGIGGRSGDGTNGGTNRNLGGGGGGGGWFQHPNGQPCPPETHLPPHRDTPNVSPGRVGYEGQGMRYDRTAGAAEATLGTAPGAPRAGNNNINHNNNNNVYNHRPVMAANIAGPSFTAAHHPRPEMAMPTRTNDGNPFSHQVAEAPKSVLPSSRPSSAHSPSQWRRTKRNTPHQEEEAEAEEGTIERTLLQGHVSPAPGIRPSAGTAAAAGVESEPIEDPDGEESGRSPLAISFRHGGSSTKKKDSSSRRRRHSSPGLGIYPAVAPLPRAVPVPRHKDGAEKSHCRDGTGSSKKRKAGGDDTHDDDLYNHRTAGVDHRSTRSTGFATRMDINTASIIGRGTPVPTTGGSIAAAVAGGGAGGQDGGGGGCLEQPGAYRGVSPRARHNLVDEFNRVSNPSSPIAAASAPAPAPAAPAVDIPLGRLRFQDASALLLEQPLGLDQLRAGIEPPMAAAASPGHPYVNNNFTKNVQHQGDYHHQEQQQQQRYHLSIASPGQDGSVSVAATEPLAPELSDGDHVDQQQPHHEDHPQQQQQQQENYPWGPEPWGSQGPRPFTYIYFANVYQQTALPEDYPIHYVINATIPKLISSQPSEDKQDVYVQVKVEDGTGNCVALVSQSLLLDSINGFLKENGTGIELGSIAEMLAAGNNRDNVKVQTSVSRALSQVKQMLKDHCGLMELVVYGVEDMPEIVQMWGAELTSSQLEQFRARGEAWGGGQG